MPASSTISKVHTSFVPSGKKRPPFWNGFCTRLLSKSSQRKWILLTIFWWLDTVPRQGLIWISVFGSFSIHQPSIIGELKFVCMHPLNSRWSSFQRSETILGIHYLRRTLMLSVSTKNEYFIHITQSHTLWFYNSSRTQCAGDTFSHYLLIGPEDPSYQCARWKVCSIFWALLFRLSSKMRDIFIYIFHRLGVYGVSKILKNVASITWIYG